MPILTSGGAAQRLALVAIVALLAVACYPDRISNPVSAPASPVRSANDPAPPPTNVVVNLPVPPTNWDGGALNNFDTGITIQPYQGYLLKLEGRISVDDNPVATCNTAYKPPYGAEGSYGPGGTGGLWGSLRYATNPGGLNIDNGGAGGASVATSDSLAGYSYPQGLVVSRSALSLAGNCGSTQFGYYLLSGSPTLTVTFLDGVEMTIDPKAVFVKRGTTVTFTARSRGSIVGSPMWRFIKSDALLDSTALCGSANPCDVIARNSGTLRVTKFLYGGYRSDAAAIRVYTSFTLDVDKNSVNYGDTVTFTPKIDGVPGNADRWRWVPDSASVSDSSACAPGTGACKKRMTGSGTMWAYANQDSASAHVTVAPAKLTLVASTNFIQGTGDTVAFSASAQGAPLTINGWKFTPDPVPPDDGFPPAAARVGMAGPTRTAVGGSHRISTTRRAAPMEAAYDIADGSSYQDCAPGVDNCRPYMIQDGWVRVSATVSGQHQVDSAHVYLETIIDSLAAEPPPPVKYQCPPDWGESLVPWWMTSTSGVPVHIQPPIYRISGETYRDGGQFDPNLAGIPWAKYKPLFGVTVEVPPRIADVELYYVCKTWYIGAGPGGKPMWGGRLISEGGRVTLP